MEGWSSAAKEVIEEHWGGKDVLDRRLAMYCWADAELNAEDMVMGAKGCYYRIRDHEYCRNKKYATMTQTTRSATSSSEPEGPSSILPPVAG